MTRLPGVILPPGLEFAVNKSGETIPAHGLFCIDDNSGELQKFGGQSHLKAVKPSTTFRRILGLNLGEDIPNNYAFVCRTKGTGLATYTTGTPLVGEGYGVKPSVWDAYAGFTGLTVKGIESTANKLMWVELESPITQLFIKATTAITTTAVSSGNQYDILTGTLGSEVDGGWTTVPNFYNAGPAFVTDDKGWISFGPSGWVGGKICP